MYAMTRRPSRSQAAPYNHRFSTPPLSSMHTVSIILILVLTVVLCGFIARSRWVKLPLPLIQIAGGT